MINADGTGETNLTRTKVISEGAPSWSPDSKKITYLRGSDPSGEIFNDIYMMNSDGTNQRRLIKATDTRDFEVGFESPSWSPDGEKIAFTREDAGDVYFDQDVCVMNAAGTGRTRLADNASSPSFTPRDRE